MGLQTGAVETVEGLGSIAFRIEGTRGSEIEIRIGLDSQHHGRESPWYEHMFHSGS